MIVIVIFKFPSAVSCGRAPAFKSIFRLGHGSNGSNRTGNRFPFIVRARPVTLNLLSMENNVRTSRSNGCNRIAPKNLSAGSFPSIRHSYWRFGRTRAWHAFTFIRSSRPSFSIGFIQKQIHHLKKKKHFSFFSICSYVDTRRRLYFRLWRTNIWWQHPRFHIRVISTLDSVVTIWATFEFQYRNDSFLKYFCRRIVQTWMREFIYIFNFE